MRILWDFRLFSYGYAHRGVGTYTGAVARSLIKELSADHISIWADKSCLPDDMLSWPVQWIPYTSGSWKKDLLDIPRLIIKNKIDVFHYWINLGPIHSLGMGLFHPCKTIGTVYDLAVELWPDVPFAASKKHTWYWKFQKHLIRSCSTVFCISNATCQDLNFIIKNARFKTPVIYMPATNNVVISPASRNPYFMTFGGAPHKNLKRTIEAFSIIKKDFPDLKIVILGNIDAKEELPVTLPSGITFEDMSHYDTHKQNASGLISCSIHEGLGLPPIEAVQFGCPLLLSTIPCYKELWKETACFANPLDVNSIADGMKNLLANQDVWQKKALQGKIVYSEMARENQKKIVAAYK